ncbi:MAG: ABC transporter permease subunit, partial [Anaerolineales bacterium]
MSEISPGVPGSKNSPFAFLRDLRFLQAMAQIIFVALVLLVGRWLVGNLLDSIQTRGLSLSFDFFKRTAGFVVGEGLPMERTDTFWYAYLIGLYNSLRVIGVGLLLATVLGVLAGVALLSTNWLLRSLVSVYVEVMRNTPLLVQLFFIYFGIILKLPSLQDRITVGAFSLSNRGFYFPKPIPGTGFTPWILITLAALIVSIVIYRVLLNRRVQQGIETRPLLWSGLVLIGVPAAVWIFTPG